MPKTRRMRVSSAAAVAVMSAITLIAACGGSSSPTTPTTPTPPTPAPMPTIPPGLTPALTSMLEGLSAYISQALQTNQDLLPRNPQSTSQLQAKIAILQNPSLGADIINGRRWAEGQATSMNGRVIPIVTVFPVESMRNEATDAVRTLEPVMPLLESFFDTPFPTPVIRVWYGFVIGNTGGGGVIYSEDRSTYEGRTGPSRLPYDAILCHELGHSYIGTESLTQFLELYAYNVIRTGSTDTQSWIFTRGWVPNLPTNQDVAAVLDIYRLIGHDAMRRAYRTIYPLRPPYGQALSQAVIQAFVAQVPVALQAQVTDKLAKVTF
jgi:hypothetical protein